MASEKKLGRPRDEQLRRCVLDTVRAQLRQSSLCGTTMEGLARQAGVGKQTLYRWWPSIADVALEALIEEAGQHCPVPDSGHLEDDLNGFLRAAFRVVRHHTGPLLRCLMVEAQKNDAFRTKFRQEFVCGRQEALAALLERHHARATDIVLIVDMVFGTLWYRLLVGHLPLSDELADQLTSATLILLGRTKAPTPSPAD